MRVPFLERIGQWEDLHREQQKWWYGCVQKWWHVYDSLAPDSSHMESFCEAGVFIIKIKNIWGVGRRGS